MRFTADCAPCLMRRVLFQSRLEGGGLEFEAVKAAVDVLSDRMADGTTSVDIATDVHRRAYQAIGSDDPYRDIKVRADLVAEPYVGMLEDAVGRSDDPLRSMVAQGLGCDDTDVLRELLGKVPGVVYMFDNCGESQLDKVLIRQLRRMGKRVVGVVRGAPILNDVTEEDALRIGLDREMDRLLTTGKFYVGIDWDDIPAELEDEIRGCGLIIAKGMANYEATSDQRLPVPIVHILRTKCRPVASSLGVPENINVVRVIMPEGA